MTSLSLVWKRSRPDSSIWLEEPEDSIIWLEEFCSMLLDMEPSIFLNSSSKFFHISLDSLNMFSLTFSKSSHVDLKKESLKNESLRVMGTRDPAILCCFLVSLHCYCVSVYSPC